MAELRLEARSTLEEMEQVRSGVRGFLAHAVPIEFGDVLGIAIEELVRNAFEHGNLGISFAEKADLLRSGEFESEVTRRAALYGERRIVVQLVASDTELRVSVDDEGSGFDAAGEGAARDALHGRGIRLAEGVFDTLTFERGGSQAIAVKQWAL